jgi:hypothetical protein
MAKKGEKATKAEKKAGIANTDKYREDVSAGVVTPGALKHGAHSKHIRKRYSDKRTREGKQLANVMQGLVDDLGGSAELTSAQLLLIDNIRSKLIVLFQISKYVDEQECIINEKGELLPCLGKNYITFTEALRRALEALFTIRKKPAIQSYEKTLKAIGGP